MHLFIMFLGLCAVSAALACLMKYRFEQTISIACLSIIVLLFLSGLAGFLSAGVYIVIAICALALGFCIFGIIKGFINRDFITGSIITPGFVMFLVSFCFAMIIHKGRFVSGVGDELTHWALVVKNMYYLDDFGTNPESSVLFRTYPPATALFQYLWVKVYGFVEEYIYISMNVLLFSLMLPVLKNTGWKDILKAPVISIIIFLIPLTIYPTFYTYIYVDPILGILLAYILFAHFTADKYDKHYMINLALAMFVLAIVKESGRGLAVIAALIITLDLLVESRNAPKEALPGFLKCRQLHIALIAFLAPVVSNFLWKLETGSLAAGGGGLTLTGIAGLFRGEAAPYQYEVVKRFAGAFISQGGGEEFVDVIGLIDTTLRYQLSYALWVLIAAILIVLWRRRCNETLKRRLAVLSYGLAGGGLVYAATLVVLYLFSYSEYEALALASFDRYMNTYLLAAVFLLVSIFIYYLSEKGKQVRIKNTGLALIIFASILLLANNIALINSLFSTDYLYQGRENVSVGRVFSPPTGYEADRIYYIYQNSPDPFFHVYTAYYEVAPVALGGSWSIGTPYGEGDVWTADITARQWLDVLKHENFTYVYLERIDEQFINEFGEAFEDASRIADRQLFKVIKENDRTLLRYAET